MNTAVYSTGDKILNVMKEMDMSIPGLAELSGVHENTLLYILAGIREPDIGTACRIVTPDGSLDIMLMYDKVTNKNLIGSCSLFRTKKYYGNVDNRLFHYGKPYSQNMEKQRQISHILQTTFSTAL